ncbi:MAG: peptide-methionine (S)-S-oxide reductase MsrA [Planctomycetota bacterium]|jgi:methionine-S-sulfoxide reductase
MNKFLIIFLSFIIIGQMSIVYADNESKDSNMQRKNLEKATFAGGCFWCMQHPFDELTGVVSTAVGYTGGQNKNPTYEEVCAGETGHAEAIEILFNPSQITYSELLDVFWKNIDPTTLNRQFADAGTQYRTAIFYHNEEQKQLAESSKEEMDMSGIYDKSIVTEITKASTFYKAEEYHQKYYEKCPVRYKLYKSGSGREQYLDKTWGTDPEQ